MAFVVSTILDNSVGGFLAGYMIAIEGCVTDVAIEGCFILCGYAAVNAGQN